MNLSAGPVGPHEGSEVALIISLELPSWLVLYITWRSLRRSPVISVVYYLSGLGPLLSSTPEIPPAAPLT